MSMEPTVKFSLLGNATNIDEAYCYFNGLAAWYHKNQKTQRDAIYAQHYLTVAESLRRELNIPAEYETPITSPSNRD